MDQARTLLNRMPALQRPCDLDLLVFFAKHPRTLIGSEQLARLLGYKLNEIAQSLDVLMATGLLTRTKTPTRPARMYVFTTSGTDGEWLPELVGLASTGEGRLALKLALAQSPAGRTNYLATQTADDRAVMASAPPLKVDTGR